MCQKNEETQRMHSFIENRKAPQILALSASRVGEWSSHSWKWLSRLRLAILQRVNAKKRISTRTMRVDQRNAISALLRVLLSHLDLKTMQIGIYNPESDVFIHLSLDYLAKRAKLPLRRAQRALSWLYEAGYVIGYRQSSLDFETNEYSYKPSVRKISHFLLQDLGITSFAIQRARNRSRKHLEKFLSNAYKSKGTRPKEQNFVGSIKEMASNLLNTASFKTNNAPVSSDVFKIYTEKIKKLMDLMPGISQEEAKRMLPSPNSYQH